MTRHVYKDRKAIFESRSFWWQDHYQKRAQAKAYPADVAERARKACQQMPEPQLDITGALNEWTYNAARSKPIEETIQLCREVFSQEPGAIFSLLVKWYWSESEWQDFVRQFNGLPEPEPLYEVVMDAGYPQFKVVPYILGTTRGQLRCKVGTSRHLSTDEEE